MHDMSHSTYAFEDVYVTCSHPSVGSLTVTGAGAGSITFSYANDFTVHDVAADGSVMASKIQAYNGTVTVEVQQTSEAALWFKKLNRYLRVAPSSEWTRAIISLTSKVQDVNFMCTGCSPQKTPDAVYQAEGQRIAFVYMAQEITES